jgi:2-polyprenyl-3-methyl-5-hydroxy-6-metoxy-1,4-benzoquinol methylase
MLMQQELRFTFGANWQSYVASGLTPARIVSAGTSLRRLLGVNNLCGKTFLDIGCGSGLFSLAACLLGAKRVVAFDYDIQSVATSQAVRERAGIDTGRWEIFQGSILDDALVAQLDQADVVYSWGVLHHTGAMWRALDHAASLVRPGGQLAIAIYNRQDRLIGGSAMWWHIKRAYNHAPAAARRAMEALYAAALGASDLARTGDPLRTYRTYRSNTERGMDYWHDVRDWLGGFPYEYASIDEIVAYFQTRLAFDVEYTSASSGAGCNEFMFRRAR